METAPTPKIGSFISLSRRQYSARRARPSKRLLWPPPGGLVSLLRSHSGAKACPPEKLSSQCSPAIASPRATIALLVGDADLHWMRLGTTLHRQMPSTRSCLVSWRKSRSTASITIWAKRWSRTLLLCVSTMSVPAESGQPRVGLGASGFLWIPEISAARCRSGLETPFSSLFGAFGAHRGHALESLAYFTDVSARFLLGHLSACDANHRQEPPPHCVCHRHL